MVEAELGSSLQEFFPSFNQEPVAAATVAQVHEARTRANERVAVKIQRPGIERLLMADLRNLRRVAALIDALGFVAEPSNDGSAADKVTSPSSADRFPAISLSATSTGKDLTTAGL